jgi:hypothetical protein
MKLPIVRFCPFPLDLKSSLLDLQLLSLLRMKTCAHVLPTSIKRKDDTVQNESELT